MLCYNNFPLPNLSEKQKAAIRNCVFEILQRREQYSELRISDLYNPDKMPDDLLEAHRNLDCVVNECYMKSEFKDEEEQLSYLFKLYEDMVEKQNV